MDKRVSASNLDLIIRVRWYAKFRLALLLFVAGLGSFVQYLSQGPSLQLILDIVLGLVMVLTHLPLMVLALRDRKQSHYPKIGLAFVALDLVAATVSVYNYGGADSRLLILFVIPIIVSGFLFGLRGTQFVGLAAAALYTSAVLLYSSSHMNAAPGVVITVVVFYSGLFMVIAALVGYTIELLSASQSSLTKERKLNQKVTASEAMIRQQANWLDLLVESLPIGVAVASYPEGTVKLANEAALDYWGDPPAPIGKPLPSLYGQDGRPYPTEKRPWHLAGRDNHMVETSEMYAHLRDGSVVALKTLAAPIPDASGKVSDVITTYADISDERRLEQAKDEFVSLASHQLKTPASSVHSAVSFLLEGEAGNLTSEQHRYLENIYGIVEREIKIIDDLLTIARADSGRMELHKAGFDLTELLREAIDELSGITDAKQQTVRLESEQPAIVEADRDRLRMVFDNLLSNACKYTPDGGKITVVVEPAGDQLVVRFTDTGIGISPEDQSRLFKKFSRIENDQSSGVSGSGLGLYLCKRIVELHQGRIEVTSAPGQGSTFSVWLPGR